MHPEPDCHTITKQYSSLRARTAFLLILSLGPVPLDRCRWLQAELQDVDSYLEKMGVKDPGLRRRLETQLPYSDPAALDAAGSQGQQQAVAPLNAAARGSLPGGSGGGRRAAAGAPVLLLCCDSGGGLGGLEPLLPSMELPVFGVCLPEGEVADAPADVAELASLAIKAVRRAVPAGSRLLLGGRSCA